MLLRRLPSRIGSCAPAITSCSLSTATIAAVVTLKSVTCNPQSNHIARQQLRFLVTTPSSNDTVNEKSEPIISKIYKMDEFGNEIQEAKGEIDEGDDEVEDDLRAHDFTKLQKFPSKHTKKKVEEIHDGPIPLFAKVRTIADSRRLRHMRKYDQLIPGVYYGNEDDGTPIKQMITLDAKVVVHEMRKRGMKLENTLYKLDIEGICSEIVVARNTQINPVTDAPLSINFLRYRPGIRVRIPVKFVGMDQNIDIKRGSFLVRINRFIECVCGEDVPQEIVVDVSKAKQKDVIRIDQAKLPEECNPSQRVPKDYVLAIIANK